MSRRIVKLPTIQNVVAGGTSVINLKLGLTYDKIEVRYTGATASQLKNIKLLLNGREVQFYENAEMVDSINRYYNRNVSEGRFVLWFVRPELEDVVEQRLTALGTADVVTATIEFEIDAAAKGAVTATAYATQSDASNAGLITKVKRFPVTFAVGGSQDISDLPKPRTAMIAAIHCFDPSKSGNIKRLGVEVDSLNAIDVVDVDVLSECQIDRGRKPNTKECVTCDWILEGELAQSLQLNVQDFRLKPDLVAAGGVTVVVEYLDVALAGI